jgi:hypothetical protein
MFLICPSGLAELMDAVRQIETRKRDKDFFIKQDTCGR